MNDHLGKPVNVDEVILKLKDYLIAPSFDHSKTTKPAINDTPDD